MNDFENNPKSGRSSNELTPDGYSSINEEMLMKNKAAKSAQSGSAPVANQNAARNNPTAVKPQQNGSSATNKQASSPSSASSLKASLDSSKRKPSAPANSSQPRPQPQAPKSAQPKPQAQSANPSQARPQAQSPSPAQQKPQVQSAAQNQTKPQAQSANPSQAKPQAQNPKPTQPPRQTLHMKPSRASSDAAKTRVTDIHANKPLAPQPKPTKQKKKKDTAANSLISAVKAIAYIVIVLLISVFLAVSIIVVGNDVYALVKPDDAMDIVIPENSSLDDIADILAGNGIIKYPEVFKLYAKLNKDNGKFVAGEYTVSPSMDYEDLLLSFKEKKPTGTVRITIPEGYTVDEIIDLFVSKGIGKKENYVDVINNYDFNYWFIAELEENGYSSDRFYRLEGYLFPDTYDFYLNSSEVTVINKLLKRFKQMYSARMKDSATALGFTTDQIVTLASMIEKESKFTTDRSNLSSVFHNRLKLPNVYPALQSDATIMYAIHHTTGERKKHLTQEDLALDSPYNSYLNNGLPPGPISNPGYSSLMYALSPADTNYYYFITDATGHAHFASTLYEHNANIDKYLKTEE